MKTKSNIEILWREVSFYSQRSDDYISLTDIAKYKNAGMTGLVISHRLSRRYTVEFIWLREQINNPEFNVTEYSNIKNESGSHWYILSSKQRISKTNAIWIISKAWRYGWTYAHKDIAFEFASWISAEFKLYLITEFQRLKQQENKPLERSVKRELTKINYKLQTDSIKNYLLPTIEEFKQNYIYADEADILNIIIFWKTAKNWEAENINKVGNIRDYATIEQLLLLANLENLNWEFIKQWLKKEKRYSMLSKIAIHQMNILFWSWDNFKKLWNK